MGMISKQVGEKIRMYRRLNRMTLDEVAAKIYKSSATLSKYENGSIVIDVETLIQLARVFHVKPGCFLDGFQELAEREKSPARGFFRSADVFYMYWSNGKNKNRILRGLLEINRNGPEDSVMVYLCTDREFSRSSAIAVYSGEIVYTDVYTKIYAENIINPVDYFFAHVLEEFNSFPFVNSMDIGIATDSCKPIATLSLICKERQEEDETLKERLMIGKEVIQSIKKGNYFTIPNVKVM